MKHAVKPTLLAACAMLATTAQAQVVGPDRPLTDPTTVASPTGAKAAPIALADLFSAAQSDSAIWSRDGRSIYYTSDRDGQLAIWHAALGTPGSAHRIGPADRKQAQIALSADGRTLFFQSDVGGRQVNDIYAIPAAGGDPVNLTSTPDTDESMTVVSPSGRFLAMARRTKTQSSNNIALLDLRTLEVLTLTDERTPGLQWWPAAFSRDGRFLLANRFDWSQTVGEAWIIDTQNGSANRLTPEGVYAEAGDITPDGRHVGVALEDETGTLQAAMVEVASGQMAKLPRSEWEERPGRISPDGRSMVVVRNVDGREVVSLYNLSHGALSPLSLPTGVNSRAYHGPFLPRFSPNGKHLLLPHSSGVEPLDYWVWDVRRGKGRVATNLAGVGGTHAVKTQIVHYRSQDGTVISGLMWMPHNLRRDGTAPAVLRPHGGPTGQTMDTFDRLSAALASRGYVVLAPNFRGSTGYGRAFLDANQKDLGGGDLEDVKAGASFLVDTGFVAAHRIGIAGGSYGGYMALIALAKSPLMWAAGVDMFGIVNWRSMWKNGTLANRRYQTTLIGDPDNDPAAYDRASPLTYLDALHAPLLVLHGENDPIVPVSEARQVVDRLTATGAQVSAHIYADEGHGFGKRENQLDSIRRTIDWFDTKMAPARR